MKNVAGTAGWMDAYNQRLYGHEGDYVFVKRGTDLEGAIAGYFGNTQILRDENGAIAEMIQYNKDHTLRVWKKGVWLEGKWQINSGQDSSKVYHTFMVFDYPTTWRHGFAANKKPGDCWILPETDNGIPMITGGAACVKKDGKAFLENSDIDVKAYFELVEGLAEAPAYDGPLFSWADEGITDPEQVRDHDLDGYFGNTFYFVKDNGQIVEVVYYKPDHTSLAWRDGHWCDCGKFMLNNGQDSSMIMQTRDDLFDQPAAWCHPFAPYKQPGDMWIAPEDRHNGEAPYPLTGCGIPVVNVKGEPVVVGTDLKPREIYKIERGIVSLEDLQKRGF